MEGNTSTVLDTDHLLWSISANDDKEAFRSLFDYYYIPLCMYAKRYIEDKSEREDIVQDVFSSVWEKRKSVEIHISAKNYLITSVKNHCINYLRKQGYLHEYQNKIIEKAPVYADNMEELYNLQELQELLEKALKKIPEEYRIAFTMSRMEGKSSAEIAEVMGISVRTVERYRNRAVEILKDDLKDYLPLIILLTLS